jgi:hypothetical protein
MYTISTNNMPVDIVWKTKLSQTELLVGKSIKCVNILLLHTNSINWELHITGNLYERNFGKEKAKCTHVIKGAPCRFVERGLATWCPQHSSAGIGLVAPSPARWSVQGTCLACSLQVVSARAHKLLEKLMPTFYNNQGHVGLLLYLVYKAKK